MDFTAILSQFRSMNLQGRYITLKDIEQPINDFRRFGKVSVAGRSVNGNPIHLCCAGSGKIKMLLWSQMHGNESTTTKAVFDLMNFLGSDHEFAKTLLERFTFFIVPMLNPDGAEAYTRENANGVDLNRDFCDLTQPESNVLFQIFEKVKPDYAYNLHDQRTIFGVGDSGKPATVSFLSPAYNEAREFNDSRLKAIDVIVSMNDKLQKIVPGQVGRFDDSFNINCVGDTFQSRGVPTILFEAGHYPGDYNREKTRELIFVALLSGLNFLSDNVVVDNRIQDYLNIPQNNANFYDFVYKNVKINYDGIEKITNFAAQYKEELTEGRILFNACIAESDVGDDVFGHQVYDARNAKYHNGRAGFPQPGDKADFSIGEVKFRNGASV